MVKIKKLLAAGKVVFQNVRPKRRTSVLIIADRKGWAFDRKARAIKKELTQFQVDVVYERDTVYHQVRFARYDVVLFFHWWQMHKVEKYLPQKMNICLGISSMTEADEDRERFEELAKKADAIFVHNRLLLERYKATYKNLFFCPNGVDTKVFKPKKEMPVKEGTLTLGWVGDKSSHGEKGFEDIILPVVKSMEHVQLKFCERGNPLPLSKMPDFYNGIDCYLCCSKNEGTPNPALEAAACGRPLISTRVGNMPEVIVDGENSFFIERSQEDLREKIKEYANNKALLTMHGIKIREKIASEWSWSKHAKNYERMFEEVIHS